MSEWQIALANHPLGFFFAFLLGLIFGSFSNVLIYRLPEEQSPFRGRSRCRHCGKTVPAYWNIPVLSFLWLRGKTACCGQTLSWQYPLVEIASGIVFLALYAKFGLEWRTACYAIFSFLLITLSVIDLHHRIIPDELSLTGLVLGLGASFVTHDVHPWSSFLGGLLGGGLFFTVAYLYEKMTKQEGLGGGDIKLLAMLGAWLGLESILIIVVVSTLLGSVVGVGLILLGRATTKAAIPFGPFLALAAGLYLFSREKVLPYFYPLFFENLS